MTKDFCFNRALFIHCMVHSLNLGVKDAIQGIRVIKDAIDNCHETIKLVKGSPKKENIFKGIQLDEESDIKKNKLRTMCPTRFTVRGDAMDAILKNFSEIQQSLDEYYDQEKNTETKARIAGVRAQYDKFDFLFGTHLGVLIFRHTDNLSRTLQGKNMSALQGKEVARSVTNTLQDLLSDDQFDLFWEQVKADASRLSVGDPVLPRKRKVPAKLSDYFHKKTPQREVENVSDHFKQFYMDAIHAATEHIKERFEQPDYEMYSNLEQLVLKAARGQPFKDEYDTVTKFYGSDLDPFLLQTQLKSFHGEYHNRSENSNFSLMDIVEDFRAFKKDPNSQWKLDHYSQIVIALKLILVLPASNCTSERSFSAMKRIKTYLRTTMSQKRLNWLMILHVHKERTDKLSIERIVNLFVSRNEERLRIFGKC